jgi:competence ComEA-like helix-hairpin-helix protein
MEGAFRLSKDLLEEKHMAQARSAEKVDLNRASQDELVEAGLRTATAEAIVRRREQQGRFRSVDELAELPGVGEATLHELRPRLTVDEGGDARSGRREQAELQRRGRETAQQADEAARRGSEELLAVSRTVAETGGTLLQDGTEFGSVWLGLWKEQMDEGAAVLQELGRCYDWRRMLDLQLRFFQSSLDRTLARLTESAELGNRMLKNAARPLEETRRGAERFDAGRRLERFAQAAAE